MRSLLRAAPVRTRVLFAIDGAPKAHSEWVGLFISVTFAGLPIILLSSSPPPCRHPLPPARCPLQPPFLRWAINIGPNHSLATFNRSRVAPTLQDRRQLSTQIQAQFSIKNSVGLWDL
ncbi:hypothetical protein C8R45DRAFT_1218436 [Mycena sanguinolenta]|nr:hypothetical protein C8R45DRAFT_1218436 [Mycena sanguinolenta]